jgi:hypothetical protein
MVKVTLRIDGGLDISLTGADSTVVTSVAFEQGVSLEQFLSSMIHQAALSSSGKLAALRLVTSP